MSSAPIRNATPNEAPSLWFAHHALWRAAQRNVSQSQIQFVVAHGRRYYAARAVHCFFGQRETEEWRALLGSQATAALEDLVVVLSTDGAVQTVLTTYRNRHALRDIKRKKSYGWPRHRSIVDRTPE